jgi:chromosomal replication initiation ATPase DnaA
MHKKLIDQDLLPVIEKIRKKAEDDISQLVGTPVTMKMHLTDSELNEAFLQELVCEEFNVTWFDIISHSREMDIKDARHVYWWLSIKYLEKTVSSLKRETKMEDHASVIYGRDRIQEIMDTKRHKLYSKIEKIEKEIISVIHDSTA